MPTNFGGSWVRDTTRMRIYARDGWRCLWCTQRVHGREATLDHFLCRKAHAGKPDNSAANIFTACRRCNSRRATALPALMVQ